jgi:kinesin family member 2/24
MVGPFGQAATSAP